MLTNLSKICGSYKLEGYKLTPTTLGTTHNLAIIPNRSKGRSALALKYLEKGNTLHDKQLTSLFPLKSKGNNKRYKGDIITKEGRKDIVISVSSITNICLIELLHK